MMTILFIITFFLGLVFGSFLNCLVYRLHVHKTVLGRSFCPKCKKKLNGMTIFQSSLLFFKKHDVGRVIKRFHGNTQL